MPIRYARRVPEIAPFKAMQIMERARALERDGRQIVHLSVGEPDFPTAPTIVDAARRALDEGRTRYTEAMGIPELRARISRYYAEWAGVAVAPERIAVTVGASGGLMLLSALLLDAGDTLLVTDPAYPCNDVFARVVGADVRAVPLSAERGHRLDPQTIGDYWSPRTRALLFASPSNPTGAVASREELEAISDHVADLGGVLIVDEIYQGLVYADPGYRSALAIRDDVFVLNSFSKYFGMTGWRLGWLVVPESVEDAVRKLAQNLFISAPTVAQYAALAAFDADAMGVHEARREQFHNRRNLLQAGLERLGLRIHGTPAGAFYLYADIRNTGMDGETFCWRLLNDYGVAATPGSDFGTQDAAHFVRFAYTLNETGIVEALARIERALADWRCDAV